jgi:hypothetical protein
MEAPMRISIYSQPWNGATHISFSVFRDGKTFVAKPVQLEWTPIEPFQLDVPATLSLPMNVAQEFLTAMSTALDDRGIKPANDHHIAGQLEATKAHLEDMRGLLAWFTQGGEHQHEN